MNDEPCWREILGELKEIRTTLAVIGEQIKDIPDHEARIRSLERLVWPLAAFPTLLAALAMVKDWI